VLAERRGRDGDAHVPESAKDLAVLAARRAVADDRAGAFVKRPPADEAGLVARDGHAPALLHLGARQSAVVQPHVGNQAEVARLGQTRLFERAHADLQQILARRQRSAYFGRLFEHAVDVKVRLLQRFRVGDCQVRPGTERRLKLRVNPLPTWVQIAKRHHNLLRGRPLVVSLEFFFRFFFFFPFFFSLRLLT
jgi:hypothetical protein